VRKNTPLLIYNGTDCGGLKIRRGSVYYCSLNGGKVWFQRCNLYLHVVLPADYVGMHEMYLFSNAFAGD